MLQDPAATCRCSTTGCAASESWSTRESALLSPLVLKHGVGEALNKNDMEQKQHAVAVPCGQCAAAWLAAGDFSSPPCSPPSQALRASSWAAVAESPVAAPPRPAVPAALCCSAAAGAPRQSPPFGMRLKKSSRVTLPAACKPPLPHFAVDKIRQLFLDRTPVDLSMSLGHQSCLGAVLGRQSSVPAMTDTLQAVWKRKNSAERRTPLLPAAGEGAPVSVANLGSPHCLFRFLVCLSVNAAGSETCGTAGACSARSAASPKGAERCQSWVRFSRAALISHTGSQLPDFWGGRAP